MHSSYDANEKASLFAPTGLYNLLKGQQRERKHKQRVKNQEFEKHIHGVNQAQIAAYQEKRNLLLARRGLMASIPG